MLRFFARAVPGACDSGPFARHSSLFTRHSLTAARGDKPKGGIKRRHLNSSVRQGDPIARELQPDGRTNKPESNFPPRRYRSWAISLYPTTMMEGNGS